MQYPPYSINLAEQYLYLNLPIYKDQNMFPTDALTLEII